MERDAEQPRSRVQPLLSAGEEQRADVAQLSEMPLSSAHCLVRTTPPVSPQPPRCLRVLLLLFLPASDWQGMGVADCGHLHARTSSSVSPQAGWGTGDRGGCRGAGAQECCFFHPSFHPGTKSVLQKAFVFPSMLPAALPASLCFACLSWGAATLAHTPRARSADSLAWPGETGDL